MDVGALPPEINSGRMYSGPGCGSMLAGQQPGPAELPSDAFALTRVN
jgi:hypothetical protein